MQIFLTLKINLISMKNETKHFNFQTVKNQFFCFRKSDPRNNLKNHLPYLLVICLH